MQTLNASTHEDIYAAEMLNGLRFTTSINLSGGPVGGIEAGNRGLLPEKHHEAATGATYAVYHYETPILWQDKDGAWVVPMVSYSGRTTAYRNKLLRGLESAGATVKKV